MSEPQRPDRPSGGPTRLAGLGMELAAAVGGACLLGYWIDRRFDTSPWGILICAMLGVVGGLYNLVRQSLHAMILPPKGKRPGDGSPPEGGAVP